MKKLFTLVLSVLMIATMSTTAFAAAGSVTMIYIGNEHITVTGNYEEAAPDDVISLDITWGSMAFTYTAGTEKWDPKTHTYTTETAGTWTCADDANKITMTNHSNIWVDVTIRFTAADSVNVTGKIYDDLNNECNVWNLAEADDTETNRLGNPENANTEYAFFKITDGAISANSDNLGTITLTISKTER